MSQLSPQIHAQPGNYRAMMRAVLPIARAEAEAVREPELEPLRPALPGL